jgi:hypothetical protein
MDIISLAIELWKQVLDPYIKLAWTSLDFWRYAFLVLLTLVATAITFRKALVSALIGRPGREHDRELLKKLLETLPTGGGMNFVSCHDFAGSFRSESLDDLDRFNDIWCNPDHEFIDPRIEASRVELYQAIHHFLSLIGQFTTLRGSGVQTIKLSSPQEDFRQSERLQYEAKQLNEAAARASKIYIDFVRLAKKRLFA